MLLLKRTLYTADTFYYLCLYIYIAFETYTFLTARNGNRLGFGRIKQYDYIDGIGYIIDVGGLSRRRSSEKYAIIIISTSINIKY